MRMIFGSLAVAATLLVASAAQANDAVHVGKAQGTAWTFLPVDIAPRMMRGARAMTPGSASIDADLSPENSSRYK